MMHNNKDSHLGILVCFTLAIMLFSAIPLFSDSAAASTRSDGTPNLEIDSHIIQMYQRTDSPNIVVVYETIVFNNTGNGLFTGPFRFDIHTKPMYARLKINNTVEISLRTISDYLYEIDPSEGIQLEPSELLQVTLEYTITYSEDISSGFTYEKDFRYFTYLVMFVIYPIEGFMVEGEGIELSEATTQSFAGAYISPHFTPVTASPGDKIKVLFSKIPGEDTGSDGDSKEGLQTNQILVLLALLIVVVLIIVLRSTKRKRDELKSGVKKRPSSKGAARTSKEMSKKDAKPERKAASKKPEARSPEELRSNLIDKKKSILLKKKRLKSDLRSGKVSKEEYDQEERIYQKKLKETNKRITKLDKMIDEDGSIKMEGGTEKTSFASIEELEERKETLLSVLKHLEKDRKEGTITDDMYQELKNEYKKEAVEVFKKLDELNQ